MTARHDPNLPWGWWLLRVGSEFEDPQGHRWPSVRSAFWQGRLGFPPVAFIEEQLEFLLRVLLYVEYRHRPGVERLFDVFAGDLAMERFYMCWLASTGFLGSGEPGYFDHGSPFGAPLSPEGRSAMLMLQATREPAWIDLPTAALLDAIADASLDDADEARETALRAFEASIVRLPRVFERARIGNMHVITLTGVLVGARMPTRSRMWSMSFPDRRVRDDLFAWMAERVDRWEAWHEIAYRQGAPALTDHLLAMFVAVSSTRS